MEDILTANKDGYFLAQKKCPISSEYKMIKGMFWLLYKLLFSRGFYFREFREPDPRENFHFNSCLSIVMTTSEKSRN